MEGDLYFGDKLIGDIDLITLHTDTEEYYNVELNNFCKPISHNYESRKFKFYSDLLFYGIFHKNRHTPHAPLFRGEANLSFPAKAQNPGLGDEISIPRFLYVSYLDLSV